MPTPPTPVRTELKISQLSETTGVALSTVKMYLREHLLPPGHKSGPNQAVYDDTHVQRVRLVHGLVKVGGLSIAAVRDVVSSIDAPGPLFDALGVAQGAASHRIDPSQVPADALATVDEVTRSWRCHPDGPGRYLAASAVAAFEAAGQSQSARWYERYAAAALLVAEADLDLIDTRDGRAAKAETVVLGTVLGDTLFAGLRRAAQEHISSIRYQSAERNDSCP